MNTLIAAAATAAATRAFLDGPPWPIVALVAVVAAAVAELVYEPRTVLQRLGLSNETPEPATGGPVAEVDDRPVEGTPLQRRRGAELDQWFDSARGRSPSSDDRTIVPMRPDLAAYLPTRPVSSANCPACGHDMERSRGAMCTACGTEVVDVAPWPDVAGPGAATRPQPAAADPVPTDAADPVRPPPPSANTGSS